MKKIAFLMLGVMAFVACSKEPPADKIKGSYGCEVRLYTRYMKNGKWRDTSYVSTSNNAVVIERIDDDHVSIKATSKKWGKAIAPVAGISDFNYQANFSGDGRDTLYLENGQKYPADISGTVSYESHDMAVSVRVPNFPNSGNKYILAFTNRKN